MTKGEGGERQQGRPPGGQSREGRRQKKGSPRASASEGQKNGADTDAGEGRGGTIDQEAEDAPGDGPGERAATDRTEGEDGWSKNGLATELDGLGGGEANDASCETAAREG